MTTPSDDPNDPGMIEKLRSWVEGNHPAEIDLETPGMASQASPRMHESFSKRGIATS